MLPLIAIFVCLPLASLPPIQAQSQHPLVSTDKPLYPIWGTGGTVNVTLSGLERNSTYFLWLQRPFTPASNLTAIRPIPGVPQQVVLKLMETEARILERCSEDMRMYAVKYDAVRRELMTEEERTAWRRGLGWIVGEPTMARPWRTG